MSADQRSVSRYLGGLDDTAGSGEQADTLVEGAARTRHFARRSANGSASCASASTVVMRSSSEGDAAATGLARSTTSRARARPGEGQALLRQLDDERPRRGSGAVLDGQ